MCDDIKALCAAQLARYPKSQAVDLLKTLYQGEFGPGHLIQDPVSNRQYLEKEYRQMNRDKADDFLEDIGFGFCRLHLHAIGENGLSLDTFQKIFQLSAAKLYGSVAGFEEKVRALKKQALPFDAAEIDNFIEVWAESGRPPFRHSEIFRETYNPAYRVVKNEFCRILPLLTKIDNKLAQIEAAQVIVAIDGDAAAGKSAFADLLKQIYQCNVLPMDHFFLPPAKRTPQRLAEPGGNVDYERFKQEVQTPLLAGKPFTYRPFDCGIWDFGGEIAVYPGRLTIIEGAYALHHTLTDVYDIKVFMKIGPEEQMRRILARNSPEMAEKFREIWIPMEKKYQQQLQLDEEVLNINS